MVLNLNVAFGLSAVLLVPAFITTAVYLILPSRRKYPHSVVTRIAASASLSSLSAWIQIYRGYENLVCNNEYDLVSHLDHLFLSDLVCGTPFSLVLGSQSPACERCLRNELFSLYIWTLIRDHVVRDPVLQHLCGMRWL